MDENADVRLKIETVRKNRSLPCRCHGYELAINYFSMLEPDCYEFCSYCDSIHEFVEEESECCLERALGAVKVFVNRCEEAPSVARAITRAIVDKLFFRTSYKHRDTGTEIILDLIEWEACNAVFKELMIGALKYDGARSEECVRAMRSALLYFGPHVISVYKLIDFIELMARNKTFTSIDDECSQLLIVIYKCLGPQARLYITRILDPGYISAIEGSYEKTRNIPIYHSRFVRYSKDNPSSHRCSEEDLFAMCRIVDAKSHLSPSHTNHANEQIATKREGMMLDAEESHFRDFGREAYNRGAYHLCENWDLRRLDDMTNYQVEYVEDSQNQGNEVRLNAYNLAFEEFEHLNCTDSELEFLHDVKDIFLPFDQQGSTLNPDNSELRQAFSDVMCQAEIHSLQPTNAFEVILQILMDNFGTEDVLDWLCVKLQTRPKTPVNDNGTKLCRKNNPPRRWKSFQGLSEYKEQYHDIVRSSSSNINCRQVANRKKANSYSINSNLTLSYPKYTISTNEEENSIINKVFPSVEKNLECNEFSEKENENITADKLLPFERIILSQEHGYMDTTREVKGNASDLVMTKCTSQVRSKKISLIRRLFQKIPFLSSKKKAGNNTPEDSKSFVRKFQFVFKRKRSQKNCNSQNLQYLYSVDHQQTDYFLQDASAEISSKMENFGSYIIKSTGCHLVNRTASFSPQRSIFSVGKQPSVNQNGISTAFPYVPEGLEDARKSLKSSSSIVERNCDDEMTCLSESESISETSSTSCSCFQKKIISKSKKLRVDPLGDEISCDLDIRQVPEELAMIEDECQGYRGDEKIFF